MLYVGIALVALLGYIVMSYNGLIKLRNIVEEGWSGIDVQLKRRYDLIPNLVETVKGYASHEKGTLEEVVKLRNSAMGMSGAGDKAEVENQISGALKSIFALAEAYPDLKANDNFQQLQSDLTEIEDEIQNSRRYYNATVRNYNTKLQVFPTNLYAGMLGFKSWDYFEAAASEKENVKVDFSDKK